MKRFLIATKLLVIAALAGALLYFVNNLTQPIFEDNQVSRAKAKYSLIFPNMVDYEISEVDNRVINTSIKVLDGNGSLIGNIYEAAMNNDYGSITLLVGVKNDTIVDLQFVYLNQTPTYASKVTDEAFISNFKNKNLDFDIEQVDIKVGATYSARTTRQLVEVVVNYHKEGR